MRLRIGLLLSFFLLSSCAIKPDHNYQLTPDEQASAGSATVNSQQNVAKLYNNAAFVSVKPDTTHTKKGTE
jgi:hypothetical protein